MNFTVGNIEQTTITKRISENMSRSNRLFLLPDKLWYESERKHQPHKRRKSSYETAVNHCKGGAGTACCRRDRHSMLQAGQVQHVAGGTDTASCRRGRYSLLQAEQTQHVAGGTDTACCRRDRHSMLQRGRYGIFQYVFLQKTNKRCKIGVVFLIDFVEYYDFSVLPEIISIILLHKNKLYEWVIFPRRGVKGPFTYFLLLLLLLLLLKKIGNARPVEGDWNPISPKTPAPHHYQPIEEKKRKGK